MDTLKPIFCLGGNPDLAYYARQAGWGYGLRSDYTPYAAPCFVDYPFKRGGGYWPNHLAKVSEWMPAVAAVPDLEHPDQLAALLRQCDELRALGIRPMVIPKYRGAVEDAPSDVLIGISVKSRYAGYHYDETKLAGRDVHLLGADVVKQVPLYRKYTAFGARVISIDSNTLQEKAQQRGAYFGKNTRNQYRWLDHRPRRDNDELFIMSLEGIKAYWQQLESISATHRQMVLAA
jgi:hypothetical protein